MNEKNPTSKFKGVYYNPLTGKKEGVAWGAKIFAGGAPYCLGFFETEIQAAETFDNAVFYFQSFRAKSDDFNFPGHYDVESPPAPVARVSEILPALQAWKNSDAGKKWILKRCYQEFLVLFKSYGQDRILAKDIEKDIRAAFCAWLQCMK